MFQLNPFHATGHFLYPLKISENQRFSDIFRGAQKETREMEVVKESTNPFQVILTHFMPLVSFYTPWHYQETEAFLFSGGIEKDQYDEMDEPTLK